MGNSPKLISKSSVNAEDQNIPNKTPREKIPAYNSILEKIKNENLQCVFLSSKATNKMAELVQVLEGKNSVEELYLNSCSIGEIETKLLCDMLSKNEKIKTLMLGENPMAGQSCLHLAKMFEKNKTLTTINLSGCGLTNEGASMIFKALSSSNHPLRELLLVKNQFDDDLEISGLQSLATLDLSFNPIGDSCAGKIGDILSTTKNLEILKLNCTRLSSIGVNSIASSMTSNNSLKIMCLTDNTGIDDFGIERIADMLKMNNSLVKLELFGTNLTPKGISFILNSLEFNTNMKEIQIPVFDTLLASTRFLILRKLTENREFENGAKDIKKLLLMMRNRRNCILHKVPRRLLLYMLTFYTRK